MQYVNTNTSLPLEPRNDFENYYEDKLYTYLCINKVEKPNKRTKNTEAQYKAWKTQQEVLRRLETGHYNCYNAPISPSGLDMFICGIVNNFDDYIIFKIKPTSCTKKGSSIYAKNYYNFYEFDVIKRFTTIKELFQSVQDDFIFSNIIATLIDYYKYNNTYEKWANILQTVKNAVPSMSENLYLIDVILRLDSTSEGGVCNTRDKMVLSLLENSDINIDCVYKIENGFHKIDEKQYCLLSKTMMELHLYKSLLFFTEQQLKFGSIKIDEEYAKMLQQSNDNADVVELIKLLKPKFTDMKLVIKKEYVERDYDPQNDIEIIEVKDMNEAKKYIFSNFDVEFFVLQKNIENIFITDYEDDTAVEYSFELKESLDED